MLVSASQLRSQSSTGAYQNKIHDNRNCYATQVQGVSPYRSAISAERFESRVNLVVNSPNRPSNQHRAQWESNAASRLMWSGQVSLVKSKHLAPALVSGGDSSPSFSANIAYPDSSGFHAKRSPITIKDNNKNGRMFWENRRPEDLSSEIKLTQQAVSERLIKIKKITSSSMLPIPQEGIAKYILTPRNELFTLEAAFGVPRNVPQYYTHASITGEPVLAAGWVYPDPHCPNNYIFSNLSGHYKTDLRSFEPLKKTLEEIGLKNTQYRFVEHFQAPGIATSTVQRDLMDPKWNRPAPKHP